MDEPDQPELSQDTNTLAELSPNTLGTEEDLDIGEPKPQNLNLKGSEEIVLEHNGTRINLSSARSNIEHLCSLALWVYTEVRNIKSTNNGVKYVG